MKIINVTILCLLVITNSCNKKTKTDADIPIITGYRMFDVNGLSIGAIGTPPTKYSMQIDTEKYMLQVFPIPTVDYLGISLKFPNLANEGYKLWIKKGQPDGIFKDNFGIDFYKVNSSVHVLDTVIKSELSYVNVSRFEKGYYRLYLQVADSVLYENIVFMK